MLSVFNLFLLAHLLITFGPWSCFDCLLHHLANCQFAILFFSFQLFKQSLNVLIDVLWQSCVSLRPWHFNFIPFFASNGILVCIEYLFDPSLLLQLLLVVYLHVYLQLLAFSLLLLFVLDYLANQYPIMWIAGFEGRVKYILDLVLLFLLAVLSLFLQFSLFSFIFIKHLVDGPLV